MKLWEKLSFRYRIWLAFICISIVAVTVTGMLSYRIAAGVVEENANRTGRETLAKTAQMLDEKLNRIQLAVYSMVVSDPYRKLVGLDPVYSETQTYYTHLSKLQSSFVQAKLYESLIRTILLVTPDGDYYQLFFARAFDIPFYNSDIHHRMQESNRQIWVEGHDDAYFTSKDRVISFVMEGPAGNTAYKGQVFIIANVLETEMQDLIHADVSGNRERFFLVNSTGDAVLRTDSEIFTTLQANDEYREALALNNGTFEADLGGRAYLINFKRLSGVADWSLFSVIPKSELLQQMNNIKWTTLWIVLGCLLVSSVFSKVLTRMVLKPLNRLKSVMKKVEMVGLDARFEGENRDDIAMIGYRFNRMLKEIERLFKEAQGAEQEKRKAEMKALQAQIDPHFLYNTLNTIYWKCQLGHLQAVEEMVLALSNLFQLGLNKGRDMMTLQNELVHVEQYLKIQQQCYEDLFNYEIDVQDGIDLQQSILKIILQPLAENAIMHGFKDQNEGGRIRIAVRKDDRHLILSVEDNGAGMSSEIVQTHMQMHAVDDGSSLKGYALGNVYRRLRLHYGEEADVRIKSEPEVCTRIELMLPLKVQAVGEKHEDTRIIERSL